MRVNGYPCHVVVGVKFPFCSQIERACLLRPLGIVSILTFMTPTPHPVPTLFFEENFSHFILVIEANFLMLGGHNFHSCFQQFVSHAEHIAADTAAVGEMSRGYRVSDKRQFPEAHPAPRSPRLLSIYH